MFLDQYFRPHNWCHRRLAGRFVCNCLFAWGLYLEVEPFHLFLPPQLKWLLYYKTLTT